MIKGAVCFLFLLKKFKDNLIKTIDNIALL